KAHHDRHSRSLMWPPTSMDTPRRMNDQSTNHSAGKNPPNEGAIIFGRASKNVAPNTSRHTSCKRQRGPIAATISRRSASVLPAIQCRRPAPMFQPSSTANTMSVKQRSPNHTSTMRSSRGDGFTIRESRRLAPTSVRTVQDLAPDEEQIQEAEDEV